MLTTRKNTMFMRLHPIVNVVYFIVLMVMTMLYQHPIILFITGVTAFSYSVYLGGGRAFKRNLALLPMMLILSVMNPLFNHRGATILFYLNHNPITKESIIYGLVAAAMIYDMIVVFDIFHCIMTSDKIICVFSKILPIGALLFTMALRFVPMYKAQLNKMRIAQKGIGRDPSQGNILIRIKNGVELISGLITWALENAIETADSMKGRGFGLAGRTYYTTMRFSKLDWKVLGFEAIGIIGIMIGARCKAFHVLYFPTILWNQQGKQWMIYSFIFFIYAIFPLILDIKEEIVWNYSRQNS